MSETDAAPPRIATCRWHGATFRAEPISQNPDGSWLMRALESLPRFPPGTTIKVAADEIVAMSDA